MREKPVDRAFKIAPIRRDRAAQRTAATSVRYLEGPADALLGGLNPASRILIRSASSSAPISTTSPPARRDCTRSSRPSRSDGARSAATIDLLAGIDQRIERVAEFLLGFRAVQKLRIVNHEHVDPAQVVLEGHARSAISARSTKLYMNRSGRQVQDPAPARLDGLRLPPAADASCRGRHSREHNSGLKTGMSLLAGLDHLHRRGMRHDIRAADLKRRCRASAACPERESGLLPVTLGRTARRPYPGAPPAARERPVPGGTGRALTLGAPVAAVRAPRRSSGSGIGPRRAARGPAERNHDLDHARQPSRLPARNARVIRSEKMLLDPVAQELRRHGDDHDMPCRRACRVRGIRNQLA